MIEDCILYLKLDDNGSITGVSPTPFPNEPDHLIHVKSTAHLKDIFSLDLVDQNGICNYKFVDGTAIPRTDREKTIEVIIAQK